MGAITHIQWTDKTWNPWEGCTKVSPGCLHCYAETRNQRFSAGANWGKGAPRRRTSVSNWNEPRRWNREAEAAYHTAQAKTFEPGATVASAPFPPKRPRVFCASLADWLDDEVPIEWLADLLAIIDATPNLDWQLLTKRPENFHTRLALATNRCADILPEFAARCRAWLNGTPPENVWIGTSVEDQTRANLRIPQLLKIPAAIRFLSCEPLLGALNLRTQGWLATVYKMGGREEPVEYDLGAGAISWVICGGESGPGARPMHPDWARSLRDQCAEAFVPFFFKQWGEWRPFDSLAEATEPGRKWGQDKSLCVLWRTGIKGSAVICDPTQAWKDGCQPLENVGKIRAGRLLDGKLHDEFPETHA